MGQGKNASYWYFLPIVFYKLQHFYILQITIFVQHVDCQLKMLLTLSLYQQQIFRLVQIESICRREIKLGRKIEISFGKGRKTMWEKEKMLATSIFSFSHCF